jgi:uncharacterized membrane protein SpoIIM required for sporulation
MKEVSFIRRNIEKWKSLEQTVDHVALHSPLELADAYTEITTDLSYARTHYPQSRITRYLNNLAAALHNRLYRNRRERYTRLVTFWTREIPEVMYRSRRELLVSFLVFAVSVLVGAVSALHDDMFVRLSLGNGYVDMTLENIRRGEPMAVYGRMEHFPMFVHIVFNNIGVAFRVFAMGLFAGFGTGLVLLYNGVMLGSFQTFFFLQGAGWESALAIWLHGTFEIAAVVIAGAAGFALGGGWLFPGTLPRGYAFRQGAKRGLKIVTGLTPVFLVAGFIESYLTRHTEYPAAVRLAVIAGSLSCVIYYYIILPYTRHHATKSKTQD